MINSRPIPAIVIIGYHILLASESEVGVFFPTSKQVLVCVFLVQTERRRNASFMFSTKIGQ